MGTNQDPLQGAEICLTTMMGTLLNSTFNALICVTVHNHSSFFGNGVSINKKIAFMHVIIDNHRNLLYNMLRKFCFQTYITKDGKPSFEKKGKLP